MIKYYFTKNEEDESNNTRPCGVEHTQEESDTTVYSIAIKKGTQTTVKPY